MALYWVIMKIHCKAGHLVELDEGKLKLVEDTPEYKAVNFSAEQLYKITGLSLPVQEIVQFTMEMLGSLRGGRISLDESSLHQQGQLVGKITNQLLMRVGDKIGEKLNNPQVEKKLEEHISRQIFRVKLNLPIRNKLSEEINSCIQ